MSRDDIAAIVAALANLVQVVCETDPAEKAEYTPSSTWLLPASQASDWWRPPFCRGWTFTRGLCPRPELQLTDMIDIATTTQFALDGGAW
jgi:hypothetical protein